MFRVCESPRCYLWHKGRTQRCRSMGCLSPRQQPLLELRQGQESSGVLQCFCWQAGMPACSQCSGIGRLLLPVLRGEQLAGIRTSSQSSALNRFGGVLCGDVLCFAAAAGRMIVPMKLASSVATIGGRDINPQGKICFRKQ